MKKTNNCLIRFSSFLLISLLILSACDFFAVGSYPFAEYYTFHKDSKERLIKRIRVFKENHPEYKLIKTNSDGHEEEVLGQETSSGYSIYFYFQDIDLTLHCIIKGGPGNSTRLGLDACSTGRDFGGNWQRINKDLKKNKNAALKKKFEEEILNGFGGWSRK